jgi:uncharacterized spore protein YtfJ
MDIDQLLTEARDSLTVRRVFGDATQHGGVTVIPAASIRGGAGGGSGQSPEGQGQGAGGGFGLSAKPAGALVIRDGEARWVSAVDRNLVVVAAAVVALALLGTVRAGLRRRS